MEEYLHYRAKYSGLTELEATERLSMYGVNIETDDDDDEKSLFSVAKVFISLRFWLMLVAAVVLLVNSSVGAGVVLLLLLAVHITTEIYKRSKCNLSEQYFQHRDIFEVCVIRASELVLKDSRFLVPDDIVLLKAGDSVPADLHILESDGVMADESLFTDDHLPREKLPGVDSKNKLKQSCVYKGTRIISGVLVGRVFATGVDTFKYKVFVGNEYSHDSDVDDDNISAMGRISAVNATTSSVFEPLIRKTVRVFNVAACAFLFVAIVLTFEPDVSGGLVTFAVTFLPAMSFALCFIPAEILCVVRLYQLETAKRLKKRHATARNLNTLELLNAMSAICVDKAGIISAHRIEVADEFSGNVDMLTNVSLLSCDVEPDSDFDFDRAISLHAASKLNVIADLSKNKLLKSYPFSKDDAMGGNLWNVNGARLFCIRGEPEKVYTVSDIGHDELFRLQERQSAYSKQGQRVLAIAYARIDDDRMPESVYDAEFRVLGLISFMNPFHDTVPMAVRNCYKAGVDLIMFTDDNEEVAAAVGAKIGMAQKQILTGEKFKETGHIEPDTNIFSLFSDSQKNEVIRLLRKRGEIVGVISDNTANARLFETADVGALVLEDSTMAVRQASDILLNSNDLGVFVDIIKETRQTHSNIKSAVALTFCATMILIAFSFVNLIFGNTDNGFIFDSIVSSLILVVFVPLCSFAYFNNRIEVKRTQQSSDFIGKGKINRGFLTKAAIQSGSLLTAMLIWYYLARESQDLGRSYVFMTFVSGLVFMKWVNMSDSTSAFRAMAKNGGGALFITGLVILTAVLLVFLPLNKYIGFSGANLFWVLTAILSGAVSQLWYDFMKKEA
ncbi:MAG: cation transporting ATPase C-terminal domain-containing protein [Oscillospiraceae bacterium]|nr:cation transporting ATPase C-terminal domain-containing protein [Oscillospiraceae bacterium]